MIGGEEARSCCLFNKLLFFYNFYCFSLKLKYFVFIFQFYIQYLCLSQCFVAFFSTFRC